MGIQDQKGIFVPIIKTRAQRNKEATKTDDEAKKSVIKQYESKGIQVCLDIVINPPFAPLNARSSTEFPDIIKEMSTTISVLEADIEWLKNQLVNKDNGHRPTRKQNNERLSIQTILSNQECETSAISTVPCSNRYSPLNHLASEDLSSLPGKNSIYLSSQYNYIKNHQQRKVINQVQNRKPIENKTHLASKNKINSKPSRKSIAIPFKNVIIHADSHGRNLGKIVTDIIGLPNEVKCMTICKPNATISQVIPSIKNNLEEGVSITNECNIIIAGSNDISRNEGQNIFNTLISLLKTKTNSKFLVSTIPKRYDLPRFHHFHEEISYFNNKISNLEKTFKNIKILNLNNLDRNLYTRHGLHLNWAGKFKISKMIVESLQKMEHSSPNFRTDNFSPSVQQDLEDKNSKLSSRLQLVTYANAVKNSRNDSACKEITEDRITTGTSRGSNGRHHHRYSLPEHFLYKSLNLHVKVR